METFEEAFGTGSMEATALGAGLGTVPWVNTDSHTTLLDSLVFHEALELEKAPRMEPVVETLSLVLLPDVGQLFHHYYVTFADTIHDTFAYVVVYPSHKPFLPARDFLEQSLASTSAFGLELSSQSCISDSLELDFLSIEEPLLAGDCDVAYSDIHADCFPVATRKLVGSDISGNRDIEEKSLLPVMDKVCSTNLPSEVLVKVFWDVEGYPYATFNCGKGCDAVLEAEAPGIVADGREFPTSWLSGLELGSLEHLASQVPAGTYKLCWKVSHPADWIIGLVMEFPLVVGKQFPPPIHDLLAGFGVLPHGIYKLIPSWDFQLDGGNGFHVKYLAYGFKKLTEVESQFLHPTSRVVSLRQRL